MFTYKTNESNFNEVKTVMEYNGERKRLFLIHPPPTFAGEPKKALLLERLCFFDQFILLSKGFLSSVSYTIFRVLIARLAAAQAAVEEIIYINP